MFDGIEYRGGAHRNVEELSAHAGIPVWNGLTDDWHPTQMLADMLTMRDHGGDLGSLSFCYLGDARNNTANSLLVGGAMLGLDVRMAGPEALWPSAPVRSEAERLARVGGGSVVVSSDVETAVAGVDFLYTDVWVSMGEPAEVWGERIDQLRPYQVNRSTLEATGNPKVKFMHCLPAFHNTDTAVAKQIEGTHGLNALEVTDDVFESSASIVFDQAENRLHTIKALMVSTLG
jgi:ornithine carbamoyltransferase